MWLRSVSTMVALSSTMLARAADLVASVVVVQRCPAIQPRREQ
jgi:hypothetical protein